jgi:probable rRNA maturation factor
MTATRRPTRPRRLPAVVPLELVDRCRPRTPTSFLRRVVRETLLFARRPDLHVSLLVTGDAEIADLHARFLGDPTPTDVICFPSDDGAEVVVSRDTAKRMAREHGHTLRAELALYVVHGILHAAGFDDVKPRDRVRMRAAEREVMRRLRLSVQPVDA